jgi:ankyrin repeat protein
MYAAQNGQDSCVSMLLERGCDTDTKDDNGETAATYALNKEIQQMIVEHAMARSKGIPCDE